MGWARYAIEILQAGQTATIKPHGHSMTGKVNNGDEVVLAPCAPGDLEVGHVVLVRVSGNVFLHLIKAIDQHRVLIGNNRGKINGWTSKNKVYGIATEVAGRRIRKGPASGE